MKTTTERHAEMTEWEKIRTLIAVDTTSTDFQAMATWPTYPAGVKSWYVCAGMNGKLLAVWKVIELQGIHVSLIHGKLPPESVCKAVFEAYKLNQTYDQWGQQLLHG